MICGIDIGLTGAVAIFTDTGQFVEVFDIPTREIGGKDALLKNAICASELAKELQMRKAPGVMPICYAEELIALNMGDKTGKAAYFSMGNSFGSVMSVLQLMGWPCVTYRPADWKRHFDLNKLNKKKGKDKNKDRSIDKAIELYPEAERFLTRKKDHNRAEAILIARYGMDRNQR